MHDVCFQIAALERATSEGCAWKCILGMLPHAQIYFFCCVIRVFRLMKVAFMMFLMNTKTICGSVDSDTWICPYFLANSDMGGSGTVLIVICKVVLLKLYI